MSYCDKHAHTFTMACPMCLTEERDAALRDMERIGLMVVELKAIAHRLTAERDRLRESLHGLLDGLDANCDSRLGLSDKAWSQRIAIAKDVLQDKAGGIGHVLLRGVWELDRSDEGYIVLTPPNEIALVMDDDTADMVGRMLLDEVKNAM